jgi:hypothetical protein
LPLPLPLRALILEQPLAVPQVELPLRQLR